MTQSSDAIYGQDLLSPQTYDLTQAEGSGPAPKPLAPHESASAGSARLHPDVVGWLADPQPTRRAMRLALALAMGTDEGLLEAKYGRRTSRRQK